jgi:putative endonuclease
MANHHIIGKKGEMLAAEFLQSKGYQIVALNKRFGRAEVDIIAKIGNEYVFVEVKTRTSNYFGFPEQSIGKSKISQLGKAGERFCVEMDEEIEIRYDLISLILEGDRPDIIHIEDAFYPGQTLF